MRFSLLTLRDNNYMLKKIIFTVIIVLTLLSVVSIVHAQDPFGLSKVKDTTLQLPSDSPANFVGRVIKWVLAVLGVILIAVIVYGGTLYMTAAGNEDRTKTAKTVLTYAIIGLVVVAAAYMLSDYVIKALWTTYTPAKTTPASETGGGAGGALGGNSGGQGQSGGSAPGGGNLPLGGDKTLDDVNKMQLGAVCSTSLGQTCAEGQCLRAVNGQNYCLLAEGEYCSTAYVSQREASGAGVSNHGCLAPAVCKSDEAVKKAQGFLPKYDGRCAKP